MRVLITFHHGLGDSVQLTSVLQHLRQYRPEWELYLRAKRGKHSVGYGYCKQVWHDQEAQPDPKDFDGHFELGWYENYNHYSDMPCSKVTNCLREVFNIRPDPSLLTYKLHLQSEALEITEKYIQSLNTHKRANGKYNTVVIHYMGNTSPQKKNVHHNVISVLCRAVREQGFIPIVLDWDRRSTLIDQKTIFSSYPGENDIWGGFGSGDAQRITALIQQSSLFVGIDSGPQKCAGATDTPAIGLWVQHLPVQFIDLCPNFIHLIPRDYPDIPPANHHPVRNFMEQAYSLQVYENLTTDLAVLACHLLTGEPRELFMNQEFLRQLRSTSYDGNYYEEHRQSGLDYLNFGDWQRRYAKWLTSTFRLKDKTVLDVGCACGSIMRGFGEAGTYVQGVDLCEHMVNLAVQKWPDMRPIIHTCDAINLHFYKDSTFDCIHSAQVAEHWRPDHVSLILKELRRVTKPGGLFVCFLDTQEMCERQKRNPELEDPTHFCIRPESWWCDRLRESGWQVVSEQFKSRLLEGDGSFMRQYDWGWFVARK